jgi:hypothetical protein
MSVLRRLPMIPMSAHIFHNICQALADIVRL